jgi:hypothetical protein
MTIERTVEVPESRRITLDIPDEFPAGKQVTVIVLAPDGWEEERGGMTSSEAIEHCRGLGKRLGLRLTSDRMLELRREDKALEEARYRRMFSKAGGED